MRIRGMDLPDLPACAALYARLANRPLVNDRWTPETAHAYLGDSYTRGALTSHVAVDDDGQLLAFVLAIIQPRGVTGMLHHRDAEGTENENKLASSMHEGYKGKLKKQDATEIW